MKSIKKASYLGLTLTMVIGLFMFATIPANATHQTGYSCETGCIVVVDPVTKYASIVDCCGGWVSAKPIRHDRIFTFWD